LEHKLNAFKHIFRALPAISWLLVVSYFSFFYVGTQGLIPSIPHFDKIAHFTFYAVLTPLALLFFLFLQRDFAQALLISVLMSWCMGGFFELLQWKVFVHRQASFSDQAANMLGATIAALLLFIPSLKKLYFRIVRYSGN
jgi:VanZ family protein